MPHEEHHRQHRVGWLRAAVLGANDGIISTSSLIIGVASASSSYQTILIAGTAGLVAGAISMAAGEYVSVSSQADTEESDILMEKESLANDFDDEVDELAEIYQERGLDRELSFTVARKLMEHDALAAHARDEIGISETTQAEPLKAAFSSACCFTIGALLPLLSVFLYRGSHLALVVAICSLFFLAALGVVSAYLSGVQLYRGILRIVFWGAFAMAITSLIGSVFNVSV